MKHKHKLIIKISLLVLAIAGFASGGLYFGHYYESKKAKPTAQVVNNEEQAADSISQSEDQVAPTSSPVPESASAATEAKIVPPMNNFAGRVTLNGFGNQPSKMQVPTDQYTDLVCTSGKYYPGYHTGVDLELTNTERSQAVSVYSISEGTVRKAATVNGYGGLIVIEYTINGEIYTAYYGHIDVKTFRVKTGDKVAAGEKLAELADACTPGNGNTRKHLHFGIHKGASIVVAGYANTQKELSSWVDPRTVIK